MGVFKRINHKSNVNRKIKKLDEELKKTGLGKKDSSDEILNEEVKLDKVNVNEDDFVKSDWRSVEETKVDVLEEEVNSIKEKKNINIKTVDGYINSVDSDLAKLKQEVFDEISEDYLFNLPSIEKKMDRILEVYEELKEGLTNEPPETDNEDPLTPLDQNFVTQDDLKKHYTTFINRVQEQISTIGGGGEVKLQYLDDIVGIATNASAYDGKYLAYDDTLGKFEFKTVGAGGTASQGIQGVQGTAGAGGGSQGIQGTAGSSGAQGTAGSTGAQGTAGSASAQGNQGTQGTQGTGGTGTQGTAGSQGTTGTTGNQGIQGIQGTNANVQGIQGSLGSMGPQGPQGTQGTAGNNGTQGTKGNQGRQGIQGVQGIQGNQGRQGIKGDTGSGSQGIQGIQGQPGIQGDLGTQGTQGTQGGTGIQGSDGVIGSQGIQGIGNQGTQGTEGNNGTQGTEGSQGTQGTQGTQASQGIQGGTGVQGADGVGAQGTAGAAASQGIQGTQGIQGSPGAGSQGIQGVDGTGGQGIQGIQGLLGSTGTQGNQGLQGIVGAQGTQASQGIQGNDGAVAAQGNQGVQGVQGPPGAGSQGIQGTQGNQGTTGNTGTQGTLGAQGIQGTNSARVYTVTNNGASDYVIDGANDPTLYLMRGFTYKFDVNASGHPFYIKTALVTGVGNQYTTGVTNNGTESGTVTFAVPYNAPSTLYYICQYHGGMNGTINISDVGPQGTQGTAGSDGVQGAAGGIGGQGIQGVQGTLGVQGNDGASASQGIQGLQGTSGGGGAGGSGFFAQTGVGIHTLSNVGIATTNPVTPLQVEQVYGVKTGIGTFNASAGVSTDFDSFDTTSLNFQTAEYTVNVGFGTHIQSQKVLVMQNGTSAYSQEYAVMFNPSLVVSIGATMTGTTCKLQATPETGITGLTTFRFVRSTLL